MTRYVDGHARLLRALRTMILPHLVATGDRQLPLIVVMDSQAMPWASATFSGQRHQVSLRLGGTLAGQQAAVDHLGSDLADADWRVPGHLVADIALVAVDTRLDRDGPETVVTIEALTVAD